MKAVNLLTDSECIFDKNTTPEWAVVYGYCEENNLMSELFAAAHAGKFDPSNYPITRGEKTVACGNWVALKGGA